MFVQARQSLTISLLGSHRLDSLLEVGHLAALAKLGVRRARHGRVRESRVLQATAKEGDEFKGHREGKNKRGRESD